MPFGKVAALRAPHLGNLAMGYYVEIPYRQVGALKFPGNCPFTGRGPAEERWEVCGRTMHSVYAMPGVPVGLATGNELVFSIPVSRSFGIRQRQLGLLSAVLVSLFFVFLAINYVFKVEFSPYIVLILLVGGILYGLKRFLRRHVWIDYVGDDVFEIVFVRRAYAETFSQLNGLRSRWKLINFRWHRR
jgi:hypothetical protein